MTATKATFVDPSYRKTSAGHAPVDGVQFHSYHTGILRYARISEDGQIMITANGRGETYSAQILGHGYLLNKAGKPIRFREQLRATEAAVKRFKALRSK